MKLNYDQELNDSLYDDLQINEELLQEALSQLSQEVNGKVQARE